MGVRTTADEKVDAAREALKTAIAAVNEAVNGVSVGDDWGADEYSDEFKILLVDTYGDLIKISHKIGRR